MLYYAAFTSLIVSGSRQPIHILEELSKLDLEPDSQQDLTKKIQHTFRHWLLRFPVQCVLVTEAILWERSVNKALERGTLDDIKCIRSARVRGHVGFITLSGKRVAKMCQTILDCTYEYIRSGHSLLIPGSS